MAEGGEEVSLAAPGGSDGVAVGVGGEVGLGVSAVANGPAVGVAVAVGDRLGVGVSVVAGVGVEVAVGGVGAGSGVGSLEEDEAANREEPAPNGCSIATETRD